MGWFQIVLFISFLEIYFLKQDPEKDAGDVVPDDWLWARYPDGYDVWLGDGSTKQVGEEELFLGKTWKLNAEGYSYDLMKRSCIAKRPAGAAWEVRLFRNC